MSEQILTILKLCLLALLYLFFLRVLRAVWTEIGGGGFRLATTGGGGDRSAPASSARPPRPSDGQRLTIREPGELAGMSFALDDEVTIGRAAGCHITLDDTFISQIHTRVFRRDGQVLVEDLGSTNGSYLNRDRLSAPMVMRQGDYLQVGSVVLELS